MAGWNSGISIPRKIDEIEGVVDPVEVYGLRSTRGATGECHTLLPGKDIYQAGLSYVTSPQKGNLGQPAGWELGRLPGATNEFSFQAKSTTASK